DVRDDGPDVDPSILPHVFERFRHGAGEGSASCRRGSFSRSRRMDRGRSARLRASKRAGGIPMPLDPAGCAPSDLDAVGWGSTCAPMANIGDTFHTRYGATGGVVDALSRRSGRIPPLWAIQRADPALAPFTTPRRSATTDPRGGARTSGGRGREAPRR